MASPALGAIDDALVLGSQAGDPAATSELVRLARPILQRYARRFFPDPARAEDMAQTALMKAFSRIHDLRSPEAFQTWLLRIARNECLNELTRQRVAQIPMSTLEDQGTALEAPAGGQDDPEEMLVRAQMQDLVRRVAATLPPHYRATLTMRALEDRSYEDISETLEIPVTVARLWYCRARKRFRTAFIQTLVARRDVPAECQEMGTAIADLIEGTLSRARRDTVQEHLSGCAACRQTEDELRNTAFRAPARLMLFAIGLSRLPNTLRRSAAAAGDRAQQWAGELALGAAGTIVLVTGAGPLGSAPAIAQAASPPAGSSELALAPSTSLALGLTGSRTENPGRASTGDPLAPVFWSIAPAVTASALSVDGPEVPSSPTPGLTLPSLPKQVSLSAVVTQLSSVPAVITSALSARARTAISVQALSADAADIVRQ